VLNQYQLKNDKSSKEINPMSLKNKKIFFILSVVLIFSIVLASFGIAYAGGIRGVGLLGGCFFLTFGIIIVLAQLIPAAILFSSFIGSAFSSFRKSELPIRIA
jgi:uncharacterized membrane protein (DUF485 family)